MVYIYTIPLAPQNPTNIGQLQRLDYVVVNTLKCSTKLIQQIQQALVKLNQAQSYNPHNLQYGQPVKRQSKKIVGGIFLDQHQTLSYDKIAIRVRAHLLSIIYL